jgi:REP element-mobilizing transposase RayT
MLIQMDRAKKPRGGGAIQQAFVFRRRGGARARAGRRARPERAGFLPHITRARHEDEQPVHITARAVRSAPNLRSERVFGALRGLFARASEKGFRLLHFSVQGNHLHLIVEADDDVALARGVQRLLSRAAMTINALARRSGKLWRDRHHRQPLTCPRQVRHAYVYVLFNLRRHELASGGPCDAALEGWDPCTSTLWFDGWSPDTPLPEAARAGAGPPPVVPPRSWLARTGWRPCGLVRLDEIPRTRR